MVLCGLVVLCALLSAAPAAHAEWAPDGVLIATTSMDGEALWFSLHFSFISDGQGGALVFWAEHREGTGDDIFAQRIDARGNLLWTQGGIAICAAPGDQTSPCAVSAGSGRVIVTWNDGRGEDPGIYAQCLDTEGNPLWTADGVAIRVASGGQCIAGAMSNGADGAIVVWQESAEAGADELLYAQLIDIEGNTRWGSNGVAVCETATNQTFNGMVSDGSGGAIIALLDFVQGRITLQRIDSTGERRWPGDGVLLCPGLCHITGMDLLADGFGGAILGWEDSRSGNVNIYAQRVSAQGYSQWTPDGVPICTAPGYHSSPRLIPDGSGDAIVSWMTFPPGVYGADIYAQRVDMNGNTLWAENGVGVCTAPYQQQCPGVVSDGEGGGILAWTDFNDAFWLDGDIYAQRISGEGTALWAPRGVPICAAASGQARPRCVPDGAGGAIVAWEDSRSGKLAIYVQRIERNGNWGYPAPSIKVARDVPGDQGGFVNLAWLASRLDPWPEHAISSYSVWRAISPEQAALALKSGGAMLSDLGDFASEAQKPLVRIEHASNRTFYWKLVSTVAAAHLDGYAEIVPTLFDSTAVCGEYHYFQVIAHGNDPGMYWISAPDSGRSIDNLAPAPPAGLAGTPGSNAEGLNLTWHRGGEADFGHYAVYRGSTEGFEPAPGNRIAALADTIYLDGEWRAGSRCCYKVAAVDIHGNESCCSLLRPEDIAGGGTRETPTATFLAQNFPNPFNPSTKIVFGLKEPEFVSLKVFDAAGRLVRVLVEADRAAGVYEVFWNGRDDRGAQMSSGLYFCRLKAGSFTSLRKMVLLK
jgi:hypothetical protein